jgi:hypothetical protein
VVSLDMGENAHKEITDHATYRLRTSSLRTHTFREGSTRTSSWPFFETELAISDPISNDAGGKERIHGPHVCGTRVDEGTSFGASGERTEKA